MKKFLKDAIKQAKTTSIYESLNTTIKELMIFIRQKEDVLNQNN